MQLRLDLAESPAPAAVLWELVGEEERRTAMAQLGALIAQASSASRRAMSPWCLRCDELSR